MRNLFLAMICILTVMASSCQSDKEQAGNRQEARPAASGSEATAATDASGEQEESISEARQAGGDMLIDCRSSDTLKPIATHEIYWGMGLKGKDTLVWVDGIKNLPAKEDMDQILYDAGTEPSWAVNYNEHVTIFQEEGEAAGFFGGFYVHPEKGNISGDAVYFCIQQYQGETLVNVGGSEAHKVEYEIVGQTPSGENIYKLKAYIEDFYWVTLVVTGNFTDQFYSS